MCQLPILIIQMFRQFYSIGSKSFIPHSRNGHSLNVMIDSTVRFRFIGRNFSKASSPEGKNLDGIKIDLNAIGRQVEEDLARANEGKPTELEKNFMNFRNLKEKEQQEREHFISWKTIGIIGAFCGSMLIVLYVLWRMKAEEQERNRKMAIGKARLGGEWELLNVNGEPEGSKELMGNWILIYFGFTNCPDICPDEIEKMVDVVDILNREEASVKILPVFISVDPERDTVDRVKKYCSEFSPKLCGFTGNKEQVAKVCKAFRVYHSEGPRSKNTDDYIVDHTVIMYLVNPDGEFTDYYGQNRRAREIAEVIKNKAFMWEMERRKEQSFLNMWSRNAEKEKKPDSENKLAVA